MRLLHIILALSMPLSLLADRPVQSARMGKVGALHPKAWRISEEVDRKGEGENFSFKVELFKGEILVDSFDFSLNEGAKNAKKSTFSLRGDLDSQNFGTELSLEFLSLDPKNNSIDANLTLNAKLLDFVYYSNNKHSAKFINAQLDKDINLSIGESSIPLREGILIKITVAKLPR